MIIRPTICLVIGLVIGGASAKNFVNENFEGRFPPDGWTKEIEGYGQWIKSRSWRGSYASGTAWTTRTGYSKAALLSHSFYLERDVYVYFRFNYNLNWYIENEGVIWQRFFLSYDPPRSGYLFSRILTAGHGSWPECSGRVMNRKAGKFKAGFKAEVRTYGGNGWVYLAADNVIISDRKIPPAVAPASLGRVKALFR